MSDGTPWDLRALPDLHAHLQLAVDLELWTIPFYATAMTSIRDPSSPAFASLLEVLRQELVHVVALANIANAFGDSPQVRTPRYGGATLPHLCFDLDTPNPTSLFAPHSTALGPLDHPRLNTMCLIEYPAWVPSHEGLRQPDLADYTSIGDFFHAIGQGLGELREHIRGGRRQVGGERFAELRISKDREAGYEQASMLLALVREQGEGTSNAEGPPAHAPVDASTTHFAQLNELRDKALPDTWAGEAHPAPGSLGAAAQAAFAAVVEGTFAAWERCFADDEGTFAETCSTPGTTASRILPLAENSGARQHEGLRHELPGKLEAGLARIIDAAGECWRAGAIPHC